LLPRTLLCFVTPTGFLSIPSFVTLVSAATAHRCHCCTTHFFRTQVLFVCLFVCTRISCHRTAIRSPEVLEPPSNCDHRHCAYKVLFSTSFLASLHRSLNSLWKSFPSSAKSSFGFTGSFDSLELTAIDEALLQQSAAHRRSSKVADFRIVMLGGTAEAAKVSSDLVETCSSDGRALGAL
jgi:hypothetical protein